MAKLEIKYQFNQQVAYDIVSKLVDDCKTKSEMEDECKKALKGGFNMNEPDGGKRTVLEYALEHHAKKEIFEVLLAHGADVNKASIVDKDWTPLHIAVTYNLVDVAEVLIKHGANVHAREMSKYTPLYYAGGKKLELCRLLLDAGADIHSEGNDKATCLHCAVSSKKNDIVAFLLERGANPLHRRKDGATPIDIAKYWGNKEILAMLKAPIIGKIRDKLSEKMEGIDL
jgi:ankyrin repeat protein